MISNSNHNLDTINFVWAAFCYGVCCSRHQTNSKHLRACRQAVLHAISLNIIFLTRGLLDNERCAFAYRHCPAVKLIYRAITTTAACRKSNSASRDQQPVFSENLLGHTGGMLERPTGANCARRDGGSSFAGAGRFQGRGSAKR